MGKKKGKKKVSQSYFKKIGKFLVNGKPMSQVVHWTLIGMTATLFGLNDYALKVHRF